MFKFLSVLVLLLTIAACDSNPPRPDVGWQLQGRIAIRTPSEARALSIRWAQSDKQFDIRLTAVLGITVAHIYGNDQGVTLETDDGIFSDVSAEALLYSRTGMDLPLSSLKYWVLAEAAPGRAHEWHDNQLRQDGWLIEYLAYKQGRPVKLKATRDGLKIILVVKNWS